MEELFDPGTLPRTTWDVLARLGGGLGEVLIHLGDVLERLGAPSERLGDALGRPRAS